MSGKLTKAFLIIQEPNKDGKVSGGTKVEFTFNPKELTLAGTAEWKGKTGKTPAMPEYTGTKAPSLSLETSQCSASVGVKTESLELRFDIASKGGGTTRILLRIGKGDFHSILQEIASKLPENAGVLSDCTAIANKANLKLLQDARKVHDDEKARAKKLVEDLEDVESFVSDKYHEAPIGQDVREEKVRDKLEEVMNSLRELE